MQEGALCVRWELACGGVMVVVGRAHLGLVVGALHVELVQMPFLRAAALVRVVLFIATARTHELDVVDVLERVVRAQLVRERLYALVALPLGLSPLDVPGLFVVQSAPRVGALVLKARALV